MRRYTLSYYPALSLARLASAVVNPNVGFEYQLQLWQRCGFEVYKRVWWDARLVRKATYEHFLDEVEKIYSRASESEINWARKDWLRMVVARLDFLRYQF